MVDHHLGAIAAWLTPRAAPRRRRRPPSARRAPGRPRLPRGLSQAQRGTARRGRARRRPGASFVRGADPRPPGPRLGELVRLPAPCPRRRAAPRRRPPRRARPALREDRGRARTRLYGGVCDAAAAASVAVADEPEPEVAVDAVAHGRGDAEHEVVPRLVGEQERLGLAPGTRAASSTRTAFITRPARRAARRPRRGRPRPTCTARTVASYGETSGVSIFIASSTTSGCRAADLCARRRRAR